jgi:sugar phosphate isomerase/epimerase
MSVPIGLQLYSLRDSLATDFEGVIRKVAAQGYAGVESANAAFVSTTPKVAARLFQELGLQVPSAHIGLPLGDKKNEVLDTMHTLGSKNLVCAFLPAEEFASEDRIKFHCDELNKADEVARENGMQLFYHNHWWEYRQQINGRSAYKVMLENLAPTVGFEVDTYWVKTGGYDPADIIREYGSRASLLHIKDGSTNEKDAMVAVGNGIMDWSSIIPAAKAEWLIVELDRCDTDMLEAVGRSYTYLTSKGYAHGR